MRSLLKDKKGDLTGLFYLIITMAALAIVILVGGYISVTVNTALKGTINSSNPEVDAAFDSSINVAENTLTAVWYVVFGVLLLGLFITSWYMRTNAIFVPVFAILLIVSIIVGIALSNAYETIYEVTEFSSIASTQQAVNFFMSNLPYVALIVGLIALVITFAKSPGGQQGFSTPPM